MKIEKIDESLENLIKIDDSTAAMDPAMELAKETAEDKNEEFDKIVVEEDNFLGAEKQPVPDKPKWTLDESLFISEDYKNWDEFIADALTEDRITSAMIADFMFSHEQAFEDMCANFGIELDRENDPYDDAALDAISKLYEDDLIEWISQHDELWADFVEYMKDELSIDDSLNEQYGVSASEEVKARKDVADYFEAMLEQEFLDDPIQAQELDFDLDSYNADWCPEEFNSASERKVEKVRSLIKGLAIAIADTYFDDELLENLDESWTDAYSEFEKIVDKHINDGPDWEDVVDEEVRDLAFQHQGDPDWEEALNRWIESK